LHEDYLDLGGITIAWLDGGQFELDGGTMFGAVPKVLWSRKYPPDAENYIKMAASPLLVRTGNRSLLIDTGLGNKLTEKQQKIFRVSSPWRIEQELARYQMRRGDIDVVILTHCDFDHAGGVVMYDAAGRPELTFPNARHIINRAEWHDATHPDRRSSNTYFTENFIGLESSGLLQLVEDDVAIEAGVALRHTGGHTRGHQIVEISGQSDCAVHLADMMPTHAHANPLWIMAYDDFPLDVIAQKERLLSQYKKRNCWFTFYHDVYMKAGRLNASDEMVPDRIGV
jgi:glyoxylase-like metal-dependent hydrolase (beta-lactamase superfamily II)